MDADKLSNEDLADIYQQAIKEHGVEPCSLWKHYKTGKVYYLVDLVFSESTKELQVVYGPDRESAPSFVRPLREWLEKIDGAEGLVQGKTVQRFTPLGSKDSRRELYRDSLRERKDLPPHFTRKARPSNSVVGKGHPPGAAGTR